MYNLCHNDQHEERFDCYKHSLMYNIYCNIPIGKIYIALINNTYFEVRFCHDDWKAY